jgi:membrane associated rhomboid family serine protease
MVLPIRDLNPTRRTAHVNWLVLAVNVGVFVWHHLFLDPCSQVALLSRFALIPQEILSLSPMSDGEVARILGSCGVLETDKVVPVTLVTSMFLHANVWHLLGNMLFLFVFGDNVEDRLGSVRYLLFYLGGGAIAAMAYVLLQPGSPLPLIGASGAVAAILGAYLVMHPHAKVLTYVPFPLYLLALLIPRARIQAWFLIFAIVRLPAWLLLGGWLAYQFVAIRDPAAGNVAYEAHIAGFVVGMVAILLIDRGRTRRGQPTYHPVRQRRRPRR